MARRLAAPHTRPRRRAVGRVGVRGGGCVPFLSLSLFFSYSFRWRLFWRYWFCFSCVISRLLDFPSLLAALFSCSRSRTRSRVELACRVWSVTRDEIGTRLPTSMSGGVVLILAHPSLESRIHYFVIRVVDDSRVLSFSFLSSPSFSYSFSRSSPLLLLLLPRARVSVPSFIFFPSSIPFSPIFILILIFTSFPLALLRSAR